MADPVQGSSDAPLRVFYDGWALAYAPGSPAAMHLLALLAVLPDEVEALVALPAASPHTLPPRANAVRRPVDNTSPARLSWDQRLLPEMAAHQGANVLHLTGPNAPLASRVPVVVSPAQPETARSARPVGLAARLRTALAYGAASGVQALVWPSDLTPPESAVPFFNLPPLAHPAFFGPAAYDSRLPDAYVLALGPLEPSDLELLVEGWKWAGPAVGLNFPLVAAGLTPAQQAALAEMTAGWGLEETLHLLPADTLPERAALVGQAAAVVCLEEPPAWGGLLLEALAAGKPVAAPETTRSAARVGPAGYLFPPHDARALGAAITTLVVEEDVAETLSRAARQRSEAWNSREFGPRLADVYRRIVRR